MTEKSQKVFGVKKKQILLGLFSVAVLGSGIAYSAATFNEPKKESSIEKKQEKDPEKSRPVWESKVEKKTEQKKKEKTKDSLTEYVESKEGTSNVTSENQPVLPSRQNLVAQLNQALDTQEKKEEQRANQQTILDSIVSGGNNGLLKPTVPNKPEQEKPSKPVDNEKPVPTPMPVPDPQPDPTPEPMPEPEPTPPPMIETDYSVLSTLTEQASGIDVTLYVSSSTETFKLELVVSKRMLEDKNSTQEAVNVQVARLQTAMAQLVLKGNKKFLNATYQLSLLVKTDVYTEETVALFVDAQEKAKQILANPDVSQQVVDETRSQLSMAMAGLKEKEEPHLSLVYLQRLVEQANTMDTTPYTTASVVVFTDKLNEVKGYIAANVLTKEENERYLGELQQAINQLQKKADTTKITELLATISGIDRSQYTEESLQRLDEKVASVNTALESEEITQVEVDTLYNELQQAFNQLEEKNDLSELPEEDETAGE